MELSIQDWGAIGEIVGGFAVVLTLLYLGIQLRQNTAGMKASAYQQWVATHTQVFSVFMDKDAAATIWAGCEDSKNLNEDTFPIFVVYCRQYVEMQQSQYHLYRQGIIDDEIWQHNLADLNAFFRFPGVRQWWDAGARTFFAPEFVQLVEESEGHAIAIFWDKERGFYPSPYHASE